MAKRVNTGFLKDITSSYVNELQGKNIVDVITFAEAPWGLNIDLLPVQRFILKTYYGMKLNSTIKDIPVNNDTNDKLLYTFSEKEFMDYLIDEGRCNLKEYKEGCRFRELILCVGRRGSKSTIASVISNYEVYKLVKLGDPQAHYGFPSGQEICITSVATSDDQAGTLFDMVRARGLSCGYVKDRIVNSTQTYFNLQTDEDIKQYGKRKKATIRLLCGGSSSVSLRGKNNIIVIMDEAAFFLDNDGRFSGDQVYQALTPSIASFTPADPNLPGDGKIIVLSSPYTKTGMFWDSYNRSFDDPENMLMFKMYSSMLNPTVDSVFLKTEKRKNKTVFNCEYGGEFSDNIASWIDDEERFDSCINLNINKNPRHGKMENLYFMGIDLGLKNDGTGIAIVHKEEDKIVLDYADVFFSGSSDVWDYPNSIYKNCDALAGYDILPMTKIAERIDELCKNFPIKSGWFDQFNGYGLLELLHNNHNLRQFHMVNVTEGINTEIYQLCKSLYSENLMTLFNHPILIPEMRMLEEEKRKRKIKVQAPNKAGAHDDISDAFVRAVYECQKHMEDTVRHVSMSFGNGTVNGGASGQTYKSFYRKKQQNHGELLRSPNIFKKKKF